MSGSITLGPAGGADPIATGFNKGWQTNTSGPGASAGVLNTALADGSDLTWVFTPALAGGGQAGAKFDDALFIPASARVRYVQPHVRLSAASSFGAVQQVLAYGYSPQEADSGQYAVAAKVNAHAAAIPFDLPARATPPSGNPYWMPNDLRWENLQFVYAHNPGKPEPDTLRMYALSLTVVWDDQPVVTVVEPVEHTVITTTLSPVVRWTFTGDSPQGMFLLRTFDIATALQPSFNPETSPAVYELQLNADWTSVEIPGLQAGAYVVYVKAATLPQGPSFPFWSAWSATSFELNPSVAPGAVFTPPLAPMVVATAEDDRGRIRLNVTADTSPPPVPDQIGPTVAVGLTGGSLGPLVDWGEVPGLGEVLVVGIQSTTGSPTPIPAAGWSFDGGGREYILWRRQDGTVPRQHRILQIGGASGWSVTAARRFTHIDQSNLTRFAPVGKTGTNLTSVSMTTGLAVAATGDLAVGHIVLTTPPTSAALIGDWAGSPDPVLGAPGMLEHHSALAGVQTWNINWGPGSDIRATIVVFRVAPAPRPAEFVRIQRSLDGGATWADVRGASRLDLVGDQVVWWDTESPNHVPVVYRALAINDDPGYDQTSAWSPQTDAVFWSTEEPFAEKVIDACVWWLKAPNNPRLDTMVTMTYGGITTLTRPRRSTAHAVLGRPEPLVTRDVRQGVTGDQIVFGAVDAAARERLQALLDWDGTLLLQGPPGEGVWGSRYIEAGDYVENRPALATVPFDTFTVTVTETGPPPGGVVAFGASYADLVLQYPTYAAINAAFHSYDEAEGVSL